MRNRETTYRFLSGSNDPNQDHRPNGSAPSDAEVLDAYSQAVVNVVERVSPAVVSVLGRGRGSGSGFLISSKGYAITIRWVTDEILAHGQVRRRQLGVVATVRRLPKAAVRKHDLLSDQVVQVMEVVRGGVANRSGIRPGDLIIAINDRITSNIDDVHRLLSLFPTDAQIEVTLVRDDRQIKIAVQ